MNIYFFRSDLDMYNRSVDTAEELFRFKGARVITNKEKSENQFRREDVEEARKTGKTLASKIDAFVLEISRPNEEIGYFFGLAILHKKPILCIHPKEMDTSWLKPYLVQMEKYDIFHIRSYTKKNINVHVHDFWDRINSGFENKEDELNIKFTLRVSPRIEKYIAWKTINTPLKKADFIRGILRKMMNEDDEYHDFRESRD